MGSIKEKLEYLNETKRDIRKAIQSRGIIVDPTDTFRSYVQKISSITAIANLNVIPFEITKNGEYEPNLGEAYNPITVKVDPNLKSKTIDKPGNYKAEDDNCEGYSDITVDISDNLKILSITKSDIGDLPEKKTFKIKDSGIEDAIGYEEVIINCKSMVDSKSIDIEPTKYGTENTYVAYEENIYGWHTFVINMSEDSGPFTVKYFNDSTLLYEETVNKGDSGYYVGALPSKPKKIFKGWDPEPINVQRNLACFAVFEDEMEVIDGAGNIHEDWEEISKTKGADLEVGSSRTLYGGEISYDIFQLTPGWSANCKLVGKYKDPGTTTTWAFTLPICARAFPGSGLIQTAGESGPIKKVSESGIGTCVDGAAGDGTGLGWNNCGLKELMGKIEKSLMVRTDKKYGSSASIVSAMRSVTKYTRHYVNSRKSFGEYAYGVYSSEDTLFVPSHHECTGRNDLESIGPVYSGVSPSFTRSVESLYAVCNGQAGGSSRPYPNIGQGEVLREYLVFRGGSSNSDLYPYVYVNSTFNDDYKEEHGYSDDFWYHEGIGYYLYTTQIFTSITVCFCL